MAFIPDQGSTMWFKGFRTRDFPQELVKFTEHKKNSPVFLVSIESLRFWGKDTTTYNYEMFPILSNTQEWTSIILARKGGSHHHSTSSFSTNVVVAKTRFISNVRSFIILRSKEHITSFTIKITERTFLVDNGKMKFSGKSTLMRIREKT